MICYGIDQIHWQQIVSLFNRANIHQAILFGSRAKGNFQNASDIDIALKGAELNLSDLNLIQLAYDELYLPWKLDLVIYDQISNLDLKAHIDRVGILLKK